MTFKAKNDFRSEKFKKQTYALNLLVNFSLKLYNDYSKFLNNKSAKIVESEILLTKQRFAKINEV